MICADLKDIIPRVTNGKATRVVASNIKETFIVRKEDHALKQSIQTTLR
jgi:hypothetical protein